MADKRFGTKLRLLREERGLTREELCGDETELSVRQLARIESGESKPTLTKINYIADCFGLTLYELMPDYIDLPDDYVNLKYDVLRTPTYGENKKKDWRDGIITEIYDKYYDTLPEEEQLAVDTIRSIFDVHDTREPIYGKEILEEYFFQIAHKERYNVNELLMSRLFIEHIRFVDLSEYTREKSIFQHLLETLPMQVEKTDPQDLFILRDVLFALVGTAGKKEENDFIPSIISAIELIMQRTQDYQKLPILKMVNWKYEFYVSKNRGIAEKLYMEAELSASILGDIELAEKIKDEWDKDIKTK